MIAAIDSGCKRENPAVRVLAICLVLAATPAAGQNRLPIDVQHALRVAGIPAASVAAVVQEVGAARPLLSVNAAAPMNPASVMKLVTTYAALELLGPGYRWKTEVYADGARRGDVLEGNLVLKGYGDPKLNVESFWMLLRGLRGKGLREIRGDVLLDRGYFAAGEADAGHFDGESFRPYNVLPDALLVNFKSLRFSFVPDAAQGAVRVFAEPHPPGLEIVNTLRLSSGACPEGRAFRDLIKSEFESVPRPRAAFTGQYPASCGERELNVALLAPADYIAGVMRQLWFEMGGAWSGAAREGFAPAGAAPLHVHESPALAEIVRDMNKYSNNVMARQLFLTLAAEASGPPARRENALRAVRQWLAAKGIAAPELVMENGSGLSRIERISAASLAALLAAAWKSAVMPEFIASLPLVAVDGTMRKRLKGDPIAGQAHVKTGLLQDSRAIAGYVLDRSGRRKAIVAIVNHPNAPAAQPALEALLSWAYEN